ncbi:hypothetical protein I3760_10G090900 [Carya illinoinensis]|nr:hypothetical protein I3760_10G090900 [Carya illinoinensis]
MSEQEILNTMSKMSLVANAYINNNIREPDIVVILTTSFTGMIRNWWDKHLFLETREAIQHAVKKDDNGLPVFDPSINSTPFDGVNTLIYTIIKHFIGTPSNITNRVSDYLNNLRCHQMSDYRWYQDVFTSRVMLRDDSQKPYWKEKFIDGLSHLFALKVKDELTDTSGFLNYDNFTYGDIFSVIKKLGISMCNDQRMLRQQLKNNSEYHLETESFDSPIIKLGCNCIDSCCKPTGKKINVLSKGEEQENLLLTMISQIQDPELKQEYLFKLKKRLTHLESEPPKQRVNFQETLERFQKKKPKEVSTQDL